MMFEVFLLYDLVANLFWVMGIARPAVAKPLHARVCNIQPLAMRGIRVRHGE